MARPNVVFIVADDMGYGDFGCYNGGLTDTPLLDALAAESVRLSQH
jgi:arylsulfatase